MMRTLAIMAVPLLLIGCGANKKYVNEQVTAAEERAAARLTTLEGRTDDNAQQLVQLQSLAAELSRKTDMAINQAAGFEKYQVVWQGEVSFGFDQYDVEPDGQVVLDEAGRELLARPRSIVEIAGYTDNTGSREYNFVLGQRRADAVRRYLGEGFSVGMFRMFTVSHGKEKATGLTDERRSNAKQRRVTVTVWAPPSPETAQATPGQ
jgi:outer membrane protein OmpA-like peptidoglycan-associated protein